MINGVFAGIKTFIWLIRDIDMRSPLDRHRKELSLDRDALSVEHEIDCLAGAEDGTVARASSRSGNRGFNQSSE